MSEQNKTTKAAIDNVVCQISDCVLAGGDWNNLRLSLGRFADAIKIDMATDVRSMKERIDV